MMKKLIIVFTAITLATSCNSKKSEKENTGTTETTTTSTTPSSNNEDAALSSWLNGKMLGSTKSDPRMDMWDKLKLNADGSCTDKDNASAKWEVKNGEFIFHGPSDIKIRIEKKDDSTVIFKGAIGDDLYKLSTVK